MDGKFDKNNSIFRNYQGAFAFTIDVWDNMQGNRWDDFDEVTARLNNPTLLDYYINNTFDYEIPNERYTQPPLATFTDKIGDCSDVASFGNYALKNAGYITEGRIVYNSVEGHVGLAIKTEDGLYYLVVNFLGHGNMMSGPYENLLEVDKGLGYGTMYDGRKPFSF